MLYTIATNTMNNNKNNSNEMSSTVRTTLAITQTCKLPSHRSVNTDNFFSERFSNNTLGSQE